MQVGKDGVDFILLTAVQHALVTDTGLAPERVFFARDGKVSANEQQVRLELAVK